MRRPLCGLGFVLGLGACTALNPAYGESEGTSGTYGASAGGTRGESGSALTLGGSTGGAEGSGSATGELTYLEDLVNSDRTSAFFCDVGDKQVP